MAPNDVTTAQLLAENRRLRQTVKFLNTQVNPRQEPTAPREGDDTRGGEIEEAYRLLVDSSLQGLLLIQEGHIVFANRRAADIMGRTVEELLTATLEQIFAFVHPEDRAMIRRRHEDRLQGLPSPSRYECRATHKDGRLRWVEVLAGLVEYRGRPATQIVLLDITAHKETEQALRETESRLQDLAVSIPGAVYQFQVRADDSWKILFMNESAAELFERPAPELTDMSCLVGCICPDDLTMLHNSVKESRRTLSLWACEFRIVTPRGRTKWLRGVSRPRSCPDGSVLWSGVLLDITALKQAEQALRGSEARLSSVFRAAPVGIGLVVQRIIKDVNQSILDMTGYARAELLERSSGVLYPDEGEFERVGRDYDGQIRQQGSGSVETRWKRKDGTIIDVWLSTAPLNANDPTAGVMFTALDITERMQTEHNLRVHRQQLRLLASELTLAEERERRRIALDLHDNACQALVLARMNLHSLLEGAPGAGDATLQEIDWTLGDTLENLRDLTFHLSSPTLYRFGLEEALEELLHDEMKGKHNLECHFFDDGQPKPFTDDVRVLLFRSVRELLVNVVKHARARRVSLDIRRVNDSIEIVVTDDGVGCDVGRILSPPVHHRHFGLIGVRERLDYIGGRLEIHSQAGRGSRFAVLAPLNRNAEGIRRSHDGGQGSAGG